MKPFITLASILFFFTAVNGQALDPSFGNNGIVRTNFDRSFDEAHALLVQPDGKILAAGSLLEQVSFERFFLLARYNEDGSPDRNFGTNGWVKTEFHMGNESSTIRAMALQADGKIIAVGSSNANMKTELAVARYHPNGSIDTTFDHNGKVLISTGGNFQTEGRSVRIQPDGKIVVGGFTSDGLGGELVVWRMHMNGALDSTFNGLGHAITAFGLGIDEGVELLLQPDGDVIVGGATIGINSLAVTFVLLRYEANGSLDSTFGDQGISYTYFGAGDDHPGALALQPDGKILFAGSTGSSIHANSALLRYDTSGMPDTTFGNQGIVITDIPHGPFESPNGITSLALQGDGKIVAAGPSRDQNSFQYEWSILRYLPDGSVDHTFDTLVSTYTSGTNSATEVSVAIQQDGKILVLGSEEYNNDSDFVLVRYDPDRNTGIEHSSFTPHSLFIYPNPLKTTITLSYTLQQSTEVSIKLINLLGQELGGFGTSSFQQAGSHEQLLTLPPELPTGPYFLLISTPQETFSFTLLVE